MSLMKLLLAPVSLFWRRKASDVVELQAVPGEKQEVEVTSLCGTDLSNVNIDYIVDIVLGAPHTTHFPEHSVPVDWQKIPWMTGLTDRAEVFEEILAGSYIDATTVGATRLPPLGCCVSKPTPMMPRPSAISLSRISNYVKAKHSLASHFRRGLPTDAGRDWLDTDAGRSWLVTPAGIDWLSGSPWTIGNDGRAWLESPAGMRWVASLSPVEFGDLVCKFSHFYSWTGDKSFLKHAKKWAMSEVGLRYLAQNKFPEKHPFRIFISADEWRAMASREDTTNVFEASANCGDLTWLRSMAGFDWLATPAGQRLLARLPFGSVSDTSVISFCKLFLGEYRDVHDIILKQLPVLFGMNAPNVEWFLVNDWFTNSLISNQGQTWLKTPRGIAWLRSKDGQRWLAKNLKSPAIACWLDSADCWWWTQTDAGVEWLFTADGQRWIATHPLRYEWQRQAGQAYMNAVQEQHARDLKSRQLDAARVHDMNIEQLREELNRQEEAKRRAEKEAEEERRREEVRRQNEEAAQYQQMLQQQASHQL